MNRERGFILPGVPQLLLYGFLALAILGVLAGLYRSIYNAGAASVRLEWEQANRKAAEERERDRLTRNAITDKREAEHATEVAELDRRYRDALLVSMRGKPAGDGGAQPLSAAAGVIACPDRQADAARRLESLEVGVLALIQRGDRAIIRTEACRAWLDDQVKLKR